MVINKPVPTFGSNLISGWSVSSSPVASGFSRRRDNKAFEGLPQMTFPSVRSLPSPVTSVAPGRVKRFVMDGHTFKKII